MLGLFGLLDLLLPHHALALINAVGEFELGLDQCARDLSDLLILASLLLRFEQLLLDLINNCLLLLDLFERLLESIRLERDLLAANRNGLNIFELLLLRRLVRLFNLRLNLTPDACKVVIDFLCRPLLLQLRGSQPHECLQLFNLLLVYHGLDLVTERCYLLVNCFSTH